MANHSVSETAQERRKNSALDEFLQELKEEEHLIEICINLQKHEDFYFFLNLSSKYLFHATTN